MAHPIINNSKKRVIPVNLNKKLNIRTSKNKIVKKEIIGTTRDNTKEVIYDIGLYTDDRYVDGLGYVPEILEKIMKDNGYSVISFTTNNINYKIKSLINTCPLWYWKDHGDKMSKDILKLKLNNPGIQVVAYSMFESNRIPIEWVNILNAEYDAVIVPSKFLIGVYKNSGVKIPIYCIPIPLDHSKILEEKSLYERYNKDKVFTFGCCAGGWERKGMEIIVRAFKNKFKNMNVRLNIHSRYGDEYYYNIIEKEISNDPRITLTVKRIDSVDNWYKNIDCYVFPSAGEGFSITPREAISYGIPTIVSKNSAHEDIKNDGVYFVNSTINKPAYYEFYKNNIGDWNLVSDEDLGKVMFDVYKDFQNSIKKMDNYRLVNLKHHQILWNKAHLKNFINILNIEEKNKLNSILIYSPHKPSKNSNNGGNDLFSGIIKIISKYNKVTWVHDNIIENIETKIDGFTIIKKEELSIFDFDKVIIVNAIFDLQFAEKLLKNINESYIFLEHSAIKYYEQYKDISHKDFSKREEFLVNLSKNIIVDSISDRDYWTKKINPSSVYCIEGLIDIKQVEPDIRKQKVNMLIGTAHAATIDALEYFGSKIYPNLRDLLRKDIEINLYGEPDKGNITSFNNIIKKYSFYKFRGFINSLDKFAEDTRLTFTSANIGTGTSVKVLTSINQNIPIVMTKHIADIIGINIPNIVATDDYDFAYKMFKLITDNKYYLEVVDLIKKISSRFSYNTIDNNIKTLFKLYNPENTYIFLKEDSSEKTINGILKTQKSEFISYKTNASDPSIIDLSYFETIYDVLNIANGKNIYLVIGNQIIDINNRIGL